MPEIVLEVENLSCGYNGVSVVTGFDLTVAEGEIVSILGSNGAGKTTTLLTLAGLSPTMSGTIRALGGAVDARKPMRWHVAKYALSRTTADCSRR